MKLQAKLLLLFGSSAVFIIAALAGILYTRLRDDRLGSIQIDIEKQLRHIDFALPKERRGV